MKPLMSLTMLLPSVRLPVVLCSSRLNAKLPMYRFPELGSIATPRQTLAQHWAARGQLPPFGPLPHGQHVQHGPGLSRVHGRILSDHGQWKGRCCSGLT